MVVPSPTRTQQHRRFRLNVPLACVGLLFVVGACSNQSSELVTSLDAQPSPAPVETPSPSPSPSSTGESDSPGVPDERLISSEGIGEAKLGMTLGELKQAVGPELEFTAEPSIMADFDAIAARQSGDIQFYILHLTGETFGDDDVIQGLMTRNPAFLTSDKVGPGTTLQDAEAVYGKATLSYNTQNESREYVRFENHPANNLSFSTGNGDQTPAGIYSTPSNTYNETQQFKDDAAVESVLVVCLVEDCTE